MKTTEGFFVPSKNKTIAGLGETMRVFNVPKVGNKSANYTVFFGYTLIKSILGPTTDSLSGIVVAFNLHSHGSYLIFNPHSHVVGEKACMTWKKGGKATDSFRKTSRELVESLAKIFDKKFGSFDLLLKPGPLYKGMKTYQMIPK